MDKIHIMFYYYIKTEILKHSFLDIKNMDRNILIMAIMLLGCTWLLCVEVDFTDMQSGIYMVYVEGGTFKMGCMSELKNCELDEYPAHNVTVNDFY